MKTLYSLNKKQHEPYIGQYKVAIYLLLPLRYNVFKKLKPYVSDYKINVFEIAWLPPETVEKFQSDFKIIADYFVQMRMNNDYKPSTQTVKHVHEMLQAMKVLTGDNRYETSYNEANMKGEFTMCEYLDRVLGESEAKGNLEVITALLADESISMSKATTKFKYTKEEIMEYAKQHEIVLPNY